MNEEVMKKYKSLLKESGNLDAEKVVALVKESLELAREKEYAWAVVDFVDPKGYGTDGDGWFELCWEYRDIGAADFWLGDHDLVGQRREKAESLDEEDLNEYGFHCVDGDYCQVCYMLANEDA